jgi:hypothetical protein
MGRFTEQGIIVQEQGIIVQEQRIITQVSGKTTFP